MYNHIRLGNQDNAYKKEIKPFLEKVASNEKFSPEIARRLGDSFFTKDLSLSAYELNEFVQKPLDMLCEVIDTMDDASRSALTLVFIRGGNLSSPPEISIEEERAIARIGGNVGEAIKGLESLNGSLLINSIKEGSYSWNFKHPTIRDAFAKIVASRPDLMDIYLTGAPLDKLFSEITCGDVGLKGVSVIVPETQYHIVIDKIKEFDTSKWFNKLSLYRFLSYRCDKKFFVQFLSVFPDFVLMLRVRSYLYVCSEVDILTCLHKFGLLTEEVRMAAVSEIKDLAIRTPDSGFLRAEVKCLISNSELSDILRAIKVDLLPNLDNIVDDWKNDYSGEDDPESYFDELKSALSDYKSEFDECEESQSLLDYALDEIEEAISDLKSEFRPSSADNIWGSDKTSYTSDINSRSVFDDVDS